MRTVKFLSLQPQQAQIQAAVQEAFTRVYDRSHYILGEELASFEKDFATFTGTKFCFGVGNGFDALTIALKACELTPEDEVIVPAHTYVATWLAVSQTHAKIVPVEPNPSTLNIDVARIEEKITNQTRVILPVHLYGQACNMTAIMELAHRYELDVVEDNAQAQGSVWARRRTGSWGTINATSFYPTKNLGALGDGGAITTSDADMAVFVKAFRNYGFEEKNSSVVHGVNSRLDEIQAAILKVKLGMLDQWNADRRAIASSYMERLKGVADLILPICDPEAFHVYHLFVVRTNYRDELRKFLLTKGIETMIHYPVPPHLQQAYHHLDLRRGKFPITEKLAETMMSLPLWPGMSSDDLDYTCDAIKEFFQ